MSDYDRLQQKLEAAEFSGVPVSVLINDESLARVLGVRTRKVFKASLAGKEGSELVSLKELYDQQDAFRSIAVGVDKDKELTLSVLNWAMRYLSVGGELVLVGEKQLGVASFEKFLGEHLEGIAKLPLKDIGRLTFWRKNSDTPQETPAVWRSNKVRVGFFDLVLCSLPGVFAGGGLDEGTRVLIEALESKKILPESGRFLDLACGCGVVGAWAVKESPKLAVTLTDDDANAVASAQKTFEENRLQAEGIFCGDSTQALPEKIKYDLIALNPPFHANQLVDYTLAERLIDDAAKVLAYKGQLVLVANKFCPYEHTLKKIFGGFDLLVETRGFKVLRAYGRGG